MLSASNRLRSAQQIGAVFRGGIRATQPSLIVHMRETDGEGVQVGFVVSKKVGNAVVRNRVKRRLRHLARGYLSGSPAGTRVVVRALPSAALNTTPLAEHFDLAWNSACYKLELQR